MRRILRLCCVMSGRISCTCLPTRWGVMLSVVRNNRCMMQYPRRKLRNGMIHRYFFMFIDNIYRLYQLTFRYFFRAKKIQGELIEDIRTESEDMLLSTIGVCSKPDFVI